MNEHIPGRVISIDGLMTPEECADLIELTDRLYKPSRPSGGGHGQTSKTGSRTSQFCVQNDDSLAEKLWKRVKDAVPENLHNIKATPYFPHQATQGDEFKPVGVNPHIRFYKYDPGQCVLKHDDYRMSRFIRTGTDRYAQQMTFLTLLVYLNEEFEGGRTRFWVGFGEPGSDSHCRFKRDEDGTEPDIAIIPQTGSGVIQDHVIQHDGEPPAKGTKYILRTDILHERPVDFNIVTDKFTKTHTVGEWTRHYEPSCLNYTE